MKKENNIWRYMILMAAVFPIFLAVNFIVAAIMVTTGGNAAGVIILALADILALVFIPYVISGYLQRRDEAVRTEWIAEISHDIRTPLSIVLGGADKLIRDSADKNTDMQDVRDHAEVIKEQALRIKELVINLNTENRISFGGTKKKTENVAISSLIREVFSGLINSLEEEKYEAVCSIDGLLENIKIKADESLVRRMLENLIGNSIRHNPDGCRIEVKLTNIKKNRECELTISDNGVGADPLTVSMLNSKNRPAASSDHGIGLRVVRKITQLYRWRLSFSSVQGQGFEAHVVMKATKSSQNY